MSYLLDTHTLLWSLFEQSRLGKKGADVILNPDLSVFVSVVSFWELSLKFAIGKLELENVTPTTSPLLYDNQALTS